MLPHTCIIRYLAKRTSWKKAREISASLFRELFKSKYIMGKHELPQSFPYSVVWEQTPCQDWCRWPPTACVSCTSGHWLLTIYVEEECVLVHSKDLNKNMWVIMLYLKEFITGIKLICSTKFISVSLSLKNSSLAPSPLNIFLQCQTQII